LGFLPFSKPKFLVLLGGRTLIPHKRIDICGTARKVGCKGPREENYLQKCQDEEKNCIFPCPHWSLSSAGIVSFTYYQGKKIRRTVEASDIAGSETQTADCSSNEFRALWGWRVLALDPIRPTTVVVPASQLRSVFFAAADTEFAAAGLAFPLQSLSIREIHTV
jgi:hypothetical protein